MFLRNLPSTASTESFFWTSLSRMMLPLKKVTGTMETRTNVSVPLSKFFLSSVYSGQTVLLVKASHTTKVKETDTNAVTQILIFASFICGRSKYAVVQKCAKNLAKLKKTTWRLEEWICMSLQ